MNKSVPMKIVEGKILLVPGQKVMLDRDLAELYGGEIRVMNQAGRRKIDRFPDDFMFSLMREEIRDLSQFVISSKMKHAPNVFAFTEQGVAMLSSVLRSKRAVHVNIAIMRTFVKLREMLSTNKELAHQRVQFERKIEMHDEEIISIFDAIRQLMVPPEPEGNKIEFHLKEKGIRS